MMSIRWYVSYPLSYRHIEELMEERGVDLDHATVKVSSKNGVGFEFK